MSAFRKAVEAADHAGMVAAVAPDVVLHSPVTHRPIRGRDRVAVLFAGLLEVLADFRYTEELLGPDGAEGLVFRARVGDRDVEGMDLLRYGADGLVAELTVMVRPASGLAALGEALGAVLARA